MGRPRRIRPRKAAGVRARSNKSAVRQYALHSPARPSQGVRRIFAIMEHHSKNVWLIRHAESIGNAGLATSRPDTIPLTGRGIEQASYLADSFSQAPALIVTSPYIRTQQSAKPTIQRFPAARQEQWEVQEFTYLSPARYLDTTAADRIPFVEAYWSRCDPHYVDGDGAESFADFIR